MENENKNRKNNHCERCGRIFKKAKNVVFIKGVWLCELCRRKLAGYFIQMELSKGFTKIKKLKKQLKVKIEKKEMKAILKIRREEIKKAKEKK